MASLEINIATYIDNGNKPLSDKTIIIHEHRQESSSLAKQEIADALRLRGRLALQKGQSLVVREQVALCKSLQSRVQLNSTTELKALIALTRARVIEARIMNQIEMSSDIPGATVSEDLRRATVQRLERAVVRQELRTQVQEAITKDLGILSGVKCERRDTFSCFG